MEATYHVTKPRQLRLKTSPHSPFPCKVKCPGNDFSNGHIFVRSCWALGVRQKNVFLFSSFFEGVHFDRGLQTNPDWCFEIFIHSSPSGFAVWAPRSRFRRIFFWEICFTFQINFQVRALAGSVYLCPPPPNPVSKGTIGPTTRTSWLEMGPVVPQSLQSTGRVGSKNQVSCRPTVVLTRILCLFGFEQIRRSFLSGRDDDYLVGSFLEKFAS